MKNYVLTLLIISIIYGIVSIIASSFPRVKKYISYFIGLVSVICMLSPIISIVNGVSDLKSNVKDYFDNTLSQEIITESNEIIISSGIESVEKGIKNTVIDKFNFDSKDVHVTVEVDNSSIESIKISKINVTLTGKASWSDTDTVKKYLEEATYITVNVTRK